MAHYSDRCEEDAERRASVETVVKQEELVGDVLRIPHTDVSRKLGEHPHPLSLPKGPCRVVTKTSVSNHGIEELERFHVLDRNVVLSDRPEDLTVVAADHPSTLRNVSACLGEQRNEFDVVVETSRRDRFGCRCRILQLGPQLVPGGLAEIEHRGLAVLRLC